MVPTRCLIICLATWVLRIQTSKPRFLLEILIFALISDFWWVVSGLGSMSSIAISYGEGGSVFCGLKSDGSHLAECYGSNSAIVYATPTHRSFLGLIGGDGFVCGLLIDSYQPYCWGNSGLVHMGVPQPMNTGSQYLQISAGDNHLCGLRKPLTGNLRNTSLVDCWGYNMTSNYVFDGQIKSISSGSGFNCGLFAENRTVFCWGDESISKVISLIPKDKKFQMISAGGYHVCGILEGVDSSAFCWGRSLDIEEEISVFVSPGKGNVDVVPKDPMLSIVGGKFHACGIRSFDREVVCWGFLVERSTLPPKDEKVYSIASGDYFTCGIGAEKSLSPVCWGLGFPNSLPIVVSISNCSSSITKNTMVWGIHIPAIVAELIFGVFLVVILSLASVIYVRYKLRDCQCSEIVISKGNSSPKDENPKALNFRRAKVFTYEELARATAGFKDESVVGRGSFSCVFKGVLKDGTVVAVKRAIMSSDLKKNSKEFHNELDLLSRLNHAHLLNLLGYCEEGGERLLVYEFMAHGSLHQHIHGSLKSQLDWVRRVTIAVQASRGIEYLHGYACPPVIHRDIKSSNILIDEEHNARVADFGLSLLGPTDGSSPLAELPAGTLGYLDPEYYRLHYLTTKSDVYSFGVLLLEILSGRKAIDMKYEDEGNIVEWAVPFIKSGEITKILEPCLKPPEEIESLRRIANVACKCVRMRGKERPSMDKVTTALERALALLMGSNQQILPTEVVLGSSRMHKKSSSNRSETDLGSNDHRFEFRAPSWITFPSVTSSQRRKSSVSDADIDTVAAKNTGSDRNGAEALRSLQEEIEPASSPQENLFLKHNF